MLIELETLCAILFVCLGRGWYSHVLHQELYLEEDIETRKTITPLSRTYIVGKHQNQEPKRTNEASDGYTSEPDGLYIVLWKSRKPVAHFLPLLPMRCPPCSATHSIPLVQLVCQSTSTSSTSPLALALVHYPTQVLWGSGGPLRSRDGLTRRSRHQWTNALRGEGTGFV